ncbi:uncharacterized protein PG986_008625 [Apiospora aurea]|uniref:Uncharacterized protein n=1 Tax=Apiospora aurea TaxID=335848 RepID=A0ABR1Q5E3_9PEZI
MLDLKLQPHGPRDAVAARMNTRNHVVDPGDHGARRQTRRTHSSAGSMLAGPNPRVRVQQVLLGGLADIAVDRSRRGSWFRRKWRKQWAAVVGG